jgi:NitT/TauT family transport system ATP-binding protein
MSNVIELKDVRVEFGSYTAVEDFTFSLAASERVAILGRTGAGKSTILSLLVGSAPATSGQVRVLGLDPFAAHRDLQGSVSMAFQAPNLMPWRSALGNVRIGLDVLGTGDRRSRNDVAQAWLDRVHLGDAGRKFPHQLSGGMRQRVSLARAFAIDPEVVFLDESFSALDEVTAQELRADFIKLCDTAGASSVIVTHSIEEAFEVAHRVIVLAKPAKIISEFDVAAERRSGRSLEEIRTHVRGLLGDPPASSWENNEPTEAAR